MSEAQRRYIGKVVIVTGGAMGMGQATAIAFGREGASVIVA
ncbi:MAG: short-chain dehydrogenase, partial [Proteobacteria bacterium]|nr:short-chain dehydrogenase [Pseudomonadota bacterium]